jgi:hypothetical protein
MWMQEVLGRSNLKVNQGPEKMDENKCCVITGLLEPGPNTLY